MRSKTEAIESRKFLLQYGSSLHNGQGPRGVTRITPYLRWPWNTRELPRRVIYILRMSKTHSESHAFAELLSKTSHCDCPILISDILNGEINITETRLHELQQISNESGAIVQMYSFSLMQPDETLSKHVQNQLMQGIFRGPFDEDTLFFVSSSYMQQAQTEDFAALKKLASKWWGGGANFWGRFWHLKAEEPPDPEGSTFGPTPIHPTSGPSIRPRSGRHSLKTSSLGITGRFLSLASSGGPLKTKQASRGVSSASL